MTPSWPGGRLSLFTAIADKNRPKTPGERGRRNLKGRRPGHGTNLIDVVYLFFLYVSSFIDFIQTIENSQISLFSIIIDGI